MAADTTSVHGRLAVFSPFRGLLYESMGLSLSLGAAAGSCILPLLPILLTICGILIFIWYKYYIHFRHYICHSLVTFSP